MKAKLVFAGLLLAGVSNLKSQSTSWNLNPVPINGANNVGIGTAVLPLIVTGDENTGIGNSALRNTQTGSFNTAAGMNGLMNNTTGDYNTALGHGADVGAGNLTNATAIGANAVITTNNAIQLGDGNVTQIFGGTGTNATFISGGLQITGGAPGTGKVLTSNASGVATWQTPSLPSSGWSILGNAGTVDGTNFIGTTDNVPLNFRVNNQKAARIEANPGTANSFLGYEAGNVNTDNYNVGVGYQSLTSNITGQMNTANGYRSLFSNVTGQGNSATGYYALGLNTWGSNNIATGSYALFNTTGGSDNAANGVFALYTNTTGGRLTGLGYSADVTANNLGNATALGADALVNASNKVVVGSTAVSVIGGYAIAGWSNLSDGRFKENINEEVPGLNFITKLRPVSYNINTKKLDEHLMQNMPDSIKALRMQKEEDYAKSASIISTGFIAQEVEAIVKELGVNFDGVNAPKNPTDNYSIGYAKFVVPLVKAVQEQQQMIEEQKLTNQKLQEQIDLLRQSNNDLINKGGTSTDINKTQNTLGIGYNMEQNVPNPFTHETVIKYTLPQQVNNAYMGVYDMTGKQVTTFAITQRGSSSITITSEKLAAGMYFYSIVADGRIVDSKRMVVAEK